jgi:hypothetical protein
MIQYNNLPPFHSQEKKKKTKYYKISCPFFSRNKNFIARGVIYLYT